MEEKRVPVDTWCRIPLPHLPLSDYDLPDIARHLEQLPPTTTLRINAHGARIGNNLSRLAMFKSLSELILTFGRLQTLGGLEELTSLRLLDVGHNAIRRFGFRKTLPHMRVLRANCNKLKSIKDCHAILKYVHSLRVLDLSGNPLCDSEEYTVTFIPNLCESLCELKEFDGAAFDAGCNSQRHRFVIGKMMPRRMGGSVFLRQLNLDSTNLSTMEQLNGFSHVVSLSLRQNKIHRVQGLEECPSLVELYLGGNALSTLRTSSPTAAQLLILDASDNKLVSLKGVELYSRLEIVYVTGNDICDISGVTGLKHVKEIFLALNSVPKRLHHLKYFSELPNLVVLDLRANSLTENNEYRRHVLFHLPALGYLDGQSVTGEEVEDAKRFFAGRLTPEMFDELLGQNEYACLSSLDLSRMRLSNVDLLGHSFESLVNLNLDHNNLRQFPLPALPSLRELRLSHNRIMSLGLTPQCLAPSLVVLHLCHNKLRQVSSLNLNFAPSIQQVHLDFNHVQTLDGLCLCTKLRCVTVRSNKIKRLSGLGFGKLQGLQELSLQNNMLENVDDMDVCKQLVSLRLEGNGIRTVQDLRALCRRAPLSPTLYLGLERNPIVQEPVYQHASKSTLPAVVLNEATQRTGMVRAASLLENSTTPRSPVPEKIPSLLCDKAASVAHPEAQQDDGGRSSLSAQPTKPRPVTVSSRLFSFSPKPKDKAPSAVRFARRSVSRLRRLRPTSGAFVRVGLVR